MEQIQYTINNVKYVLIEVPVVSGAHDKHLNKLAKKYGCVHQGIKEINRGGLFSNTVIVFKWLVPEQHLVSFNNELE